MIGAKTLQIVATAAETDVKLEERLQGHYLTGALERSLDLSPGDTEGDLQAVELHGLDYLDNLEYGIQAEQIPQTSGYYRQILAYVKLRFKVDGNKAARIAGRIVAKHRIEGQPTAASFVFSKTGERLNAVAQALDKGAKSYDNLFNSSLDREFDSLVDADFPDLTIV